MLIESNVSRVPSMRLMYPAHGGFLMSVGLDEPVYAVQEGYGQGDGERHRFQVMLIPRGNVLASFWTDLGPASDFDMNVEGTVYQAPPYHQIVLAEHSVAECRYMAEQGRMDDFAIRMLHEQVNESRLFEEYARLIEEDMALVRNRSTFGPGGQITRNGYSPAGARRQQEVLTKW